MFDLLFRYRRLVLLGALIALAVAVRSLEDKDEDDYTVLDRAVVTLVTPLQSGLRYVLDGVSHGYERYVANVNAAERNDKLGAELAEVRRRLVAMDEIKRENSRLSALIALRERSTDVEYLAARVIGNSTSALFRSVRIDIGSNDGVVRGMGVLSAEGVVGRVMNVAAGSSEVMLIVDAASSVDVLVARSRARGRLRGLGDETALTARIDYVSRSANVEERDTILTTGAGKVFPKGLLVGWVSKVDRVEHGLYQEVMIEPAAKLLAMDEVFVVKAFGPEALVGQTEELETGAPLDRQATSQPTSMPTATGPEVPPSMLDSSELESEEEPGFSFDAPMQGPGSPGPGSPGPAASGAVLP